MTSKQAIVRRAKGVLAQMRTRRRLLERYWLQATREMRARRHAPVLLVQSLAPDPRGWPRYRDRNGQVWLECPPMHLSTDYWDNTCDHCGQLMDDVTTYAWFDDDGDHADVCTACVQLTWQSAQEWLDKVKAATQVAQVD